jgi:restriction system protein
MNQYNRIRAGKKSIYADECFRGGFIGLDYGISMDLTNNLPENWKDFNREFIPIWLKNNPGKTKIGAGLSCAFIWTLCKGLNEGDIVVTPYGKNDYRAGKISGPYTYSEGQNLPHRRPVEWLTSFNRSAMSEELKRSAKSAGSCCDISIYAEEIESLMSGKSHSNLVGTEIATEDVSAFAMERHLEDFLVQNWKQTELGRRYDIYSDEDGEKVGQQYPTDSGPLDILAVRKDRKELLVVELKRGRASDVVVGQTLRYMGYVKEELAEDGQTVAGVIIALEDDGKIRRALAVTPNITFYCYKITFELV